MTLESRIAYLNDDMGYNVSEIVWATGEPRRKIVRILRKRGLPMSGMAAIYRAWKRGQKPGQRRGPYRKGICDGTGKTNEEIRT